MIEKQKILLDMDIGDDIDDALALSLALEEPAIELVGVTTVFHNTDKRARIAKKMLALWGRDIPVYAGIPLGQKVDIPYQDTCCQYTPDLDAPEYSPLNNFYEDGGVGAVDFILRSARKYAGELTLVAIGPLTNVAAAIDREPETMKKIKRIVLMGGCFYNQFKEWNILCDPLAAKTVLGFQSEVVCIGLDVTECTVLTQAQHKRLLEDHHDEKRAYLASLVKLWTKFSGRVPTLHDPLTVYYVAHPEAIRTESTWVEVETEGDYTRGMTVDMDLINKFSPYRWDQHRVMVARQILQEDMVEKLLNIVLN